MQKQAFAAVRKDQKTGQEWFDLDTIHSELSICVEKAHDRTFKLFGKTNPVVRYSQVTIREVPDG